MDGSKLAIHGPGCPLPGGHDGVLISTFKRRISIGKTDRSFVK